MPAIANIQNSVPRINLRRSTMSPMDPAGSARMKKGSAEAVWMSAICRGLLLSEVINQAAPTLCIKAPTSETKSAIRRSRNNGIRRGRHGLDGTGDEFLLSTIAGHYTNQERYRCLDTSFCGAIEQTLGRSNSSNPERPRNISRARRAGAFFGISGEVGAIELLQHDGSACLVTRGTIEKCRGWILALKERAGGVGGTILSQAVRQREPYLESCVAGFRADLNIAPVLLHNSLNRVEAKPCSFAHSLRGEEGFEDVRLRFRQNPGTVIADLNHNAIVLAIGSNSKLAVATHRVNGIVNDVGPNLIQLAPERIHEKRNALVVPVYDHPAFELVVQNCKRRFKTFHDIDVLQGGLIHVGVFLDGTDQICDS